MSMHVPLRGCVKNLRGTQSKEIFGKCNWCDNLSESTFFFIRNEVRSTFNFWSTLLCETRKMSRERASLAEVMASEMVARVEVMTRDVQALTKRVSYFSTKWHML